HRLPVPAARVRLRAPDHLLPARAAHLLVRLAPAPTERLVMTTASPRRNTRKALGGVVFYALLAVVLIPFLFVFWYMITTSLKSPQDLTASTFRWFFTPTLDNYAQ